MVGLGQGVEARLPMGEVCLHGFLGIPVAMGRGREGEFFVERVREEGK